MFPENTGQPVRQVSACDVTGRAERLRASGRNLKSVLKSEEMWSLPLGAFNVHHQGDPLRQAFVDDIFLVIEEDLQRNFQGT